MNLDRICFLVFKNQLQEMLCGQTGTLSQLCIQAVFGLLTALYQHFYLSTVSSKHHIEIHDRLALVCTAETNYTTSIYYSVAHTFSVMVFITLLDSKTRLGYIKYAIN